MRSLHHLATDGFTQTQGCFEKVIFQGSLNVNNTIIINDTISRITMHTDSDLTLAAYKYHLPEGCIAQHPADKRDNSRLMAIDTISNKQKHLRFSGIAGLIGDKDMLVLNNTRVFPARLHGHKETGGKVEVFLLELPAIESNGTTAIVTALIKASKRPKVGSTIIISRMLSCLVTEELADGKVRLLLTFDVEAGLLETLKRSGQVPLPPYISRKDGTSPEDVDRYQTVYASKPGAVAAPTAGLHFTEELLSSLRRKGVEVGQVTLHVGYGTFAPVRDEDITRHQIHHEYLNIPEETVSKIEMTKKRGGKIWAIGTTTVRALEFGAAKTGKLVPTEGWCDLYIFPGFRFQVIDNLITNFHLPDSSLMFLVAALLGRENLLNSYDIAIKEGYKFFSYGDAMAITGGQSNSRE